MKNILLVSDDQSVCQNLTDILAAANYNVVLASNASHGFEAVGNLMPDVVISHASTMHVDMWGVLHDLRTSVNTRSVPFIFLASRADVDEMLERLDTSFDDYLILPFKGTEFLNIIEKKVNRQKLHEVSAEWGTRVITKLDAGGRKQLKESQDESFTVKYEKDAIIYKESQDAKYLYYVKQGRVLTFCLHSDRVHIQTEIYREGDFFGDISIIGGSEYLETAQALEPIEIVAIPKRNFVVVV